MIAVNGMKMPLKCEVCRFNLGGYCVATDGEQLIRFNDRRQSWCPLRDVKQLSVVRIYPHEDVVMVPNDKLLEYALSEIGKTIGKSIVDTPEFRVIKSWPYNTYEQSDACCDIEADSVKLSAYVWVVEPEVDVT